MCKLVPAIVAGREGEGDKEGEIGMGRYRREVRETEIRNGIYRGR